HLRVGIFDPVDEASVKGVRDTSLARDVGSDAEADEMRNGSDDVDVRPADRELIELDRVPVCVDDRRIGLVEVIGVDGPTDPDRWGVVRIRRGLSPYVLRRGKLRRDQPYNHERPDTSHQPPPCPQAQTESVWISYRLSSAPTVAIPRFVRESLR